MGDLYKWEAKFYADSRPSYPTLLFQFIASKTPNHDLAWDVGSGSGQAAISLAGIYKKVIATDTSSEQLAHAPNLPNIRYQQTPATMTLEKLAVDVAQQGTVDLVTAATSFHWFDRPNFYQQVNWVLKKPHGVVAVWSYKGTRVDDSVDAIYQRYWDESARPFLAPNFEIVEKEYRTIDFPFEPVEGTDHTGPFEFEAKKLMDLDTYLTWIRSSSVYRTARDKGVELLTEETLRDFKLAWEGEHRTTCTKVVRFPIFLRIGRVPN